MNSRWIAVIVLASLLFSLVFSLHKDQVEAASRTESITYQTTYRSRRYSKQALVYLPDGYSNRQKYNVIYLMHGSTESAETFYRDGNFRKVLDRLIGSGKLKKAIVVFPTYYPNRSFISTDYYRDNRLNRAFARHELIDDLIPAVENRYSTYADGVSRTALQASRTHRAFGGFSMGRSQPGMFLAISFLILLSICQWRVTAGRLSLMAVPVPVVRPLINLPRQFRTILG